MENKLESLNLLKLTPISDLGAEHDQKEVRIRGFVSALRCTRYVAFVVLRAALDTIQLVVEMPKEGETALQVDPRALPIESFVEVVGRVKVVKKPVKACSKSAIEVDVARLEIISGVSNALPFSLKDAAATAEEREINPSICNVAYSIRMDNRFLDFRMPQTLSIFRVVNGFMSAFREFAAKNKFIEVKTTKIIQSGSEGGSNLFSMDYFGRKAFLAQSPQLYKQMAIAGGMQRVFEIGHVYRAEQSNTNRYLSEFTGVDFEMEIDSSYYEAINTLYAAMVHVMDTIRRDYAQELEIIRKYRPFVDLVYPREPLIITHHDAVDLLIDHGVAITHNDDFSRESEKILGSIIKAKHNTDFFVVIDYPAAERAFYTYVDKQTGKSHSYDFIMRGEEIMSGARRVNSYEDLKAAIASRNIPIETIQFYVDTFQYAVPPHAGGGIGLERMIKSYLDFDDIRYFALYPRDPNRLYP